MSTKKNKVFPSLILFLLALSLIILFIYQDVKANSFEAELTSLNISVPSNYQITFIGKQPIKKTFESPAGFSLKTPLGSPTFDDLDGIQQPGRGYTVLDNIGNVSWITQGALNINVKAESTEPFMFKSRPSIIYYPSAFFSWLFLLSILYGSYHWIMSRLRFKEMEKQHA